MLRDALASIYSFPPAVPFEVIVVDNASEDGSAAMVEGEFPDVRLIRNAKNEGFARGNNQGASIAQGNMLLLLGSDVVLIDNSIQKLYEGLRSRPGAGAVSCRLLNPDRSPQHSCRHFPSVMDAVFTYLSLHRLARSYNMAGFDFYATQEVDQPAATCLLLRREAPGSGVIFDERFTILYNDVDLCFRLRNAGWKIVYLGDVEIVHHGSQSTRRAGTNLRVEMYRNILLYYTLHYGIFARLVLTPICLVRLLLVTRSTRALRLILPLTTSS
jgi:GT2 family glycosyltransferase